MAILPSRPTRIFRRAATRCLPGACAWLSLAVCGWAELHVHELAPGETLEAVAERFLDGTGCADELRNYNGLDAQANPEAGSLIAIPGPLRAEAIGRVQQASRALQRAVDAQAETFAPAEFEHAAGTEAAARDVLVEAAYSQAVALSELAAVRSDRARRAADDNARVSRDAVAAAVSGSVTYRADGPASWRPVEPGTAFPVQSAIRTAEDARMAIHLDDGSRLTLAEGTTFTYRDYITDLRDGQVNALLAVTHGGIHGDVPVSPGSASGTILQVGQAVVVVKGASLRARVDAKGNSFVEVLRGEAVIEYDDERMVVQEGQGALLDLRRKTLITTELLAAPAIDSRFGSAYATARQNVELGWAPPAGGVASGYAVELSRDEGFVDVVDSAQVAGRLHRTPTLAEGNYFWRVVAVDENGLRGFASAPSRLTVTKDLWVKLAHEGPAQETGGRLVAGRDTVFRGVPAQPSTSVVRYEYSVNGSPFAVADDGIRFDRDGRYEVRVRGIAADHDTGPEDVLVAWVDATGPRVSLDVSPPFAEMGRGRLVRAALDASDETGLDRIEFALGDGLFAPYDGPMVLPASKEHLLRFRAWDVLGNASPDMSFRVRADRGS